MRLVIKGTLPSLVEPIDAGHVNSIVYPHKLFVYIMNNFGPEFLWADPTALRDFWEKFRRTSRGRVLFAEHPHLRGRTPEDSQHMS